ncbi:Hypothetical_protein [Hexamita inflata]|uniref:Hypothetical_protein n=1 Tax=Hexamita inflata TaxID=28002 RepID=A0AA86P4Q7_9EUKA|nr:Hypothetical protein HINF_LOCUS19579 [Hexamita inflata]
MLSIYNTSDLRKLTYYINITLVQRDDIKLGRQYYLSTFTQSLTMQFQSIIQTSIQLKQAIHQIHTTRKIRTKSYFYSHLSYKWRFKWNQKCLTQQQNVQIAFTRKATPENCKQDAQFMILIPCLNLEQIRNNANTITHCSSTQPKAVIGKKSPEQTPFVRNSQRRVCEEV